MVIEMNKNPILDHTERYQAAEYEPYDQLYGYAMHENDIIGGADGPTAVFVGRPKAEVPQSHTALSSMHFEHVKEIEWRIVFQEKPNEDLTVSLI